MSINCLLSCKPRQNNDENKFSVFDALAWLHPNIMERVFQLMLNLKEENETSNKYPDNN